jgi:hypothetical protein
VYQHHVRAAQHRDSIDLHDNIPPPDPTLGPCTPGHHSLHDHTLGEGRGNHIIIMIIIMITIIITIMKDNDNDNENDNDNDNDDDNKKQTSVPESTGRHAGSGADPAQ